MLHPFHLMHLLVGSRILLQQFFHHLLQSPVRCLFDLPQMVEQLPFQDQVVVKNRLVLLQEAPAHHPVFAQRLFFRFSQCQIREIILSLFRVCQFFHHGGCSFLPACSSHSFGRRSQSPGIPLRKSR